MQTKADKSDLPTRSRAWLLLSLATILLWGAWGTESKLIVEKISPWMNQVLFPLGLLPVLAWAFQSRGLHAGGPANRIKGAAAAILTGVLAGAGNVAFYLALSVGGKASIVTPLTCLFPVVTVLLAYYMLRERVTSVQAAGLLISFVSIYLLST